ncbi:MAG: M1 family peptidase [Gammaproteobacteria bacterium]|nr:M1 family peptidase [Gammaproteobacteria bacterium]MBU1416129.1 M1 family peptidase [Gammaproteobacteria bacterium]
MKCLLSLLLALPCAAVAATQLDLDVRLDPATRAFAATARIADDTGIDGFRLAPEFEITSMTVNGRPAKPSRRFARTVYALPSGSRRVEIRYRATLKPLAALDHRQVLGDRSATAAPEGSFLPAAAGWYPDVGRLFSYRLALTLPAGQKGLVPGELVKESEGAEGYRAEFAFPNPAEGIDLMAGPYVVAERALKLPGGRDVKLRTWFHPELAELAPGYLDDSARYLSRYSKLIGDYPFTMFSVVSSPTPTGFGMPGLTYLGRDVLRLPFIRATSLGHEILHNWWGNGVYPDWRRGNWSEGLTTYMADYAYKRDAGEDAAREMRLGWLRDLAAVPAAEDTPLKDFTSRHHGISSIVGYDKAAMLFLMLEDEIGRPAFERGLRLFWQRHRFRTAGWSDLEAAFSKAAGRPLAAFFRQWVERAGAPEPRLESATQRGNTLTLRVSGANGYALGVSPRLTFVDRSETRRLQLKAGATTLTLPVKGQVKSVELDPDYRLWRRVDPALLPPILREVFVAPQAAVVVVVGDDEWRTAALALAARCLDATPDTARTTLPTSGAVLIVGKPADLDVWLAAQGLPARPAMPDGGARVWAGRDDRGRPYAVVAAADVAALEALMRPLPHYGRQSWLAFDGVRAIGKGVWPPRADAVPVKAAPR